MSPLSVLTDAGGHTGGGGGSSRGRRTISVMRFTPVQIITEKPESQRPGAPQYNGTMVTTRRSSVILTNIRGVTRRRRATVITRMPTVGTANTTIITEITSLPCPDIFDIKITLKCHYTEFVYLRHLL